jgi:hypothetical protein
VLVASQLGTWAWFICTLVSCKQQLMPVAGTARDVLHLQPCWALLGIWVSALDLVTHETAIQGLCASLSVTEWIPLHSVLN